MAGIGAGFVEAAQPIEFGGVASPEIAMLGKDEPHPMALLSPGGEFRQRLLEHAAGLRFDEAAEVEGIFCHSPIFRSAATGRRLRAAFSESRRWRSSRRDVRESSSFPGPG